MSKQNVEGTVNQPWRGLFGVIVTLIVAFGITMLFSIETYMGIFTLWAMALVPILLVATMGWGGQFPPIKGVPRLARGFALLAFVFVVGTVVYLLVRYLLSAGVPQPFTNLYEISTVIVTFFLLVAFGTWPFHKLPAPLAGFTVWVVAYLLMLALLQLFNFSTLQLPDGHSVPFYAPGGPPPFAPFAAIAPMGAFQWQHAFAFFFWMVVILLTFPLLDMWPFAAAPSVMKQPVMGIVVTLSCMLLAAVAYTIGVVSMKIEPLKFVLAGISYLFGILMLMLMFQTWPGQKFGKQPAAGFANIGLGIIVGIGGFYLVRAFARWHFGPGMTFPNDIFAMANIMLGLAFPAWAAYSTFFDFWPLPPDPNTPFTGKTSPVLAHRLRAPETIHTA
jgi:hypothetical protein